MKVTISNVIKCYTNAYDYYIASNFQRIAYQPASQLLRSLYSITINVSNGISTRVQLAIT